MKKILLFITAAAGVIQLAGCAHDEPRTTTTTTEETSVRRVPAAEQQTTTTTESVRPGY